MNKLIEVIFNVGILVFIFVTLTYSVGVIIDGL